MNVVVLNGSWRKNWNTDLMLKEAAKGAESAGAQVEYVDLYSLDYKGCRGCLACKLKSSKKPGRCAVNDDLLPVLDRIEDADGLILGSPVYFGDITAQMRAFIERFLYQYLNFDGGPFLTDGKLRTGFIYTMNMREGSLQYLFRQYEQYLGWVSDYVGTVEAGETLHVSDYSKYHLAMIDEEARQQRRREVFPQDLKKAYELGRKVAAGADA